MAVQAGHYISDSESAYGSNKLKHPWLDVEAAQERPRKVFRTKVYSSPSDDETVGFARGLLLVVIAARTLMMIPRPGSPALAAAALTAKMKGWDDFSATIFHAVVAFLTTDVLLGVFVAYHATRLHTRNVFLVLSMCFLWAVLAFNSQPEVISYWKHVDEEQHAMDVLVSVIKNAPGAVTQS